MKQTIRRSVFETNSSSTHSLTMCSGEEWDKFKNGNMYIDWDNNLYTEEEVIKTIEEGEKEENLEKFKLEDGEYDKSALLSEFAGQYEFMDFEEWEDGEELESFWSHHTTPSGDEVVAFGRYGWN